MSVNQPTSPIPVDRRQETVTTQEPGYAATEQVTRDVAAERRQSTFQVNRIVWSILGLLEILLGMRFVLKLIAADANSGFGAFMYGITGPFIAPFEGLLGTPASGGMILEVTTLVAMAVYALLFWGIARVIEIVTDRPVARTVSRSTREEAPGSERTTHTTRSG